jgi:hypothetical protein
MQAPRKDDRSLEAALGRACPQCPPRVAGQVAAPVLGRAEEAASRARGGGRGGPGITWAEAGPGAPGGLSLESGRRRQRERQRVLALFLPGPSAQPDR